MDIAAARRRLLLSTTMLMGALTGYARQAYAGCVLSGGSTYQCSGVSSAVTINHNDATVSTLASPAFSVNTAAGNAISITGDGALSYTDLYNSPLTASSGYGLYIKSTATPGSITVNTTGATTGTIGISAKHYGSGALTITANGDVARTGAGSNGILAYNKAGTDLTVNTTGSTTGGQDGIFAKNNGSGALTVTTGTGTTTSGGDNGIEARVYGGGALTVTANGNVTATNSTGHGIFAYNKTGTYLAVTTAAGTTVSGGANGIEARNSGSGALTITTNGVVAGTNSFGIYALSGAAGTDLTVNTTGSTTGGHDGIFAKNSGSGALTVTTGIGTTTSGGDNGIEARVYGGGALTVTANGNVTATNSTGHGIFAYNKTGTYLAVTTARGHDRLRRRQRHRGQEFRQRRADHHGQRRRHRHQQCRYLCRDRRHPRLRHRRRRRQRHQQWHGSVQLRHADHRRARHRDGGRNGNRRHERCDRVRSGHCLRRHADRGAKHDDHRQGAGRARHRPPGVQWQHRNGQFQRQCPRRRTAIPELRSSRQGRRQPLDHDRQQHGQPHFRRQWRPALGQCVDAEHRLHRERRRHAGRRRHDRQYHHQRRHAGARQFGRHHQLERQSHVYVGGDLSGRGRRLDRRPHQRERTGDARRHGERCLPGRRKGRLYHPVGSERAQWHLQRTHHQRVRVHDQPELHRQRRAIERDGGARHTAEQQSQSGPAARRHRAQRLFQQRRCAGGGFFTLFGLSGSALGNALSQLSGETGTAAQQAAFQPMQDFLALMLDPLVATAGAAGAAGGPALAFAGEPASRSPLPPDVARAYAKAMPVKAAPMTFAQRWSAWGAGFGGGAHVNGDAVMGSHGTHTTTAGIAAGADYRLSSDTVLGFALAGGDTRWSLSDGFGSGRSDFFQAGAHGLHRIGPAYISAALAYAWHRVRTTRTVNVSGSDVLEGDFHPQVFGGRFEAGYRFGAASFGITPYTAAQVQQFYLRAYSENATAGSGNFALSYNRQRITASRSELGLGSDYRFLWPPTDTAVTLRARAAWAHNFHTERSLTASFQTLPGASFVVDGAAPDADTALVSAAAQIALHRGVALAAKFDGEFGGHMQSYAGTGTLRFSW